VNSRTFKALWNEIQGLSSTCPVFKYFQGLEFRRKKFKYFQGCMGTLLVASGGIKPVEIKQKEADTTGY